MKSLLIIGVTVVVTLLVVGYLTMDQVAAFVGSTWHKFAAAFS